MLYVVSVIFKKSIISLNLSKLYNNFKGLVSGFFISSRYYLLLLKYLLKFKNC